MEKKGEEEDYLPQNDEFIPPTNFAVIENGQTPSYYAPIKSKFIDAYNASSDRKAFLKQDRKSVVAGSSSGAQLLVDRRNEAIHDAEAR